MEKNSFLVHERTKKRKTSEDAHSNPPFSLDELSQDLLERVLSRLPASSFLRLRSVCKKWSSIASSTTFQIACSHIPFRDPWFLMVDQELNQSVIFDTSEGCWRNIIHPSGFNQSNKAKRIAEASTDGLVCFRNTSGGLSICNPVTGACRDLPLPELAQPLHAIAMSNSSFSSYSVVLVSGEFPNLYFTIFNSDKNQWEEEMTLEMKAGDLSETVYFLSKAGEVVATNMVRSPSKEFSSVLVIEDGDEIVYFLSHSGTVMACNLNKKIFFEHPRLLPIYSEYSIDVVVCKGEMMVVVLSEFLETASLRVWRFCKGRSWMQVAAMPPSMSHEFYGKKADINCDGCGDIIFVCLNSTEFSSCVICNVVVDEWVELPKCVVNGKVKEFVSAFSFEPRLEACV